MVQRYHNPNNNLAGEKKVQTKDFAINSEGDTFDIGERFQIQTCIFYLDKKQAYESKPVSLVVMMTQSKLELKSKVGTTLGDAFFDMAAYAP